MMGKHPQPESEQYKENAVVVSDPYQGLLPEKTIMAQILRIAIAYLIVMIVLFLLN